MTGEMKERLKWIYLTKYDEDTPVGMRTWLGDYRADIMLKNCQFEYWCSETWNSGQDIYWTRSRFSANVFQAMADAEKWLQELNEALYEAQEG